MRKRLRQGLQGSRALTQHEWVQPFGMHLAWAQRSERKKLIFVVTDGEPADNDVRDPQYLRADTKKAVEQAGRLGVSCYALSLDPYADQYVSSIFGAGRFTVLDHVERLPEKLPMLYLGLTH